MRPNEGARPSDRVCLIYFIGGLALMSVSVPFICWGVEALLQAVHF